MSSSSYCPAYWITLLAILPLTPASYTAPTNASVTSFISPTVTPCFPNGAANTRLRALLSRCSAYLGVDGPPPSLATPAPPSTTAAALALPPAPSTPPAVLRLPDGNSPPPATTFPPFPTATPGEPSFRRFPSSPPLPLDNKSTDSFLIIIPPARATDESVLIPPSEVPPPPTLPFFPLLLFTIPNSPFQSSSV
ncbi:uncharacterized protein LOC131996192 [Stomoxys calcitrans]|uniref:uncharacterized protein LOC131996192 n=1 Tax=Stomoxys calcitrans TaxID=35570 RepID=UPI0027E2717C|nr:uncharacterized protein LOC131996192 [Stomoxys calcitrans]